MARRQTPARPILAMSDDDGMVLEDTTRFMTTMKAVIEQQTASQQAFMQQTIATLEDLQRQQEALAEEIKRLRDSVAPPNLMEPQVQGEESGSRFMHFRQFMKLRTPHFSGAKNPKDADAWLSRVIKDLDIISVDHQYWVLFATYLLDGEADWWWQWESARLPQPVSWDEFRKAFDSHFIPTWFKDQKELEFIKLEQGSMTVVQYQAKFNELSYFARCLVSNEEMKVRKFERGLRVGLRANVQALGCSTFSDVVNRAIIYERHQAETHLEAMQNGQTFRQSAKRRAGDDGLFVEGR